MMTKIRKGIAVAVLAVSLFGVGACSESGNSPPRPASSTAQVQGVYRNPVELINLAGATSAETEGSMGFGDFKVAEGQFANGESITTYTFQSNADRDSMLADQLAKGPEDGLVVVAGEKFAAYLQTQLDGSTGAPAKFTFDVTSVAQSMGGHIVQSPMNP